MLFERLVIVVLIDLAYGVVGDVGLIGLGLKIEVIGLDLGWLIRKIIDLRAVHVFHVVLQRHTFYKSIGVCFRVLCLHSINIILEMWMSSNIQAKICKLIFKVKWLKWFEIHDNKQGSTDCPGDQYLTVIAAIRPTLFFQNILFKRYLQSFSLRSRLAILFKMNKNTKLIC